MRKVYVSIFLALSVNAQAQPNNIIPVKDAPTVVERYEQKIQIVFALDATGSMSGLMSAAKDKIWSIASSITQSDQPPLLEIGFVFYRDRGDEFITKRVPLSDSIDNVYAELIKIEAAGGGDTPESLNQGLYEAVQMFNWDPSPSVFKTVFLVGDCEPHMKYIDDVKYPETCIIAKGKGIVLNTILMGNNAAAKKVFEEIPKCGSGDFVNVDMKMNDIAVVTPFDKDISDLNDKFESMSYYYGNDKVKSKGYVTQELNNTVVTKSKNNVKAQRAEYKSKKFAESTSSSKVITNDLLADYSSNKVTIDSIKVDELPDELRNLTIEERKEFVKNKSEERNQILKEMQEKIKLRNNFIKEEMAKRSSNSVKNSFNNIIYENLKAQAKRVNIQLTGDAKF